MCGRELDVDREAERAGEEEAVLGTDGRPATSTSSPRAPTTTRTRFV